jgi:hypothetical protein
MCRELFYSDIVTNFKKVCYNPNRLLDIQRLNQEQDRLKRNLNYLIYVFKVLRKNCITRPKFSNLVQN